MTTMTKQVALFKELMMKKRTWTN